MVGRIRPSAEEINWVHTNIEYCMQNYMKKNETMQALSVQLNINPVFTRTVWEKLEMDNPEFFRVYYAKMSLKDQIEQFNILLWKQCALMNPYQSVEIEMTDGPQSDITTQQISTPNSAEYIQQQQLNMFSDDGSSFPSSLQVTSDWSDQSREIDVSQVLAQQRMNEEILRAMSWSGRSREAAQRMIEEILGNGRTQSF